MRPTSSSGRRPRNNRGSSGGGSNNNNHNNRRGNNNRSQVFDSNGPDVRIRGTAFQVHEKYIALAKDAFASSDQVMAHSYLQHAEHYQRIISGWDEYDAANQQHQPQQHHQQSTRQAPVAEEEIYDDLSLPSSILTPAPVPSASYDDMEAMG